MIKINVQKEKSLNERVDRANNKYLEVISEKKRLELTIEKNRDLYNELRVKKTNL